MLRSSRRGAKSPLPAQKPAARFEVAAPDLASFGWVVAISPDGGTIVYARGEGSERILFRRRIDELDATPIRGTEGGTNRLVVVQRWADEVARHGR